MGKFTSIDLFAGAGGLSLGLERAGFECIMLNENYKTACATLRKNRPHWNVVQKDIAKIDFTEFKGKIDLLTGGFPCQAFSTVGKKKGFDDPRGTIFFEFVRAIKESQPKMVLGENVRGLVSHNKGKTFEIVKKTIEECGYKILFSELLAAVKYNVPQKRNRVFIVAARNDLDITFTPPAPNDTVFTVRDALKAGALYPVDVPDSVFNPFTPKKKKFYDLIPPEGNWEDLSEKDLEDYKNNYYFRPGRKSILKRLNWDQPCITLTCVPNQNWCGAIHPELSRTLTTREYARMQTFPDEWEFCGGAAAIYKQIGNAVPVNLAEAVGTAVFEAFKTEKM